MMMKLRRAKSDHAVLKFELLTVLLASHGESCKTINNYNDDIFQELVSAPLKS